MAMGVGVSATVAAVGVGVGVNATVGMLVGVTFWLMMMAFVCKLFSYFSMFLLQLNANATTHLLSLSHTYHLQLYFEIFVYFT